MVRGDTWRPSLHAHLASRRWSVLAPALFCVHEHVASSLLRRRVAQSCGSWRHMASIFACALPWQSTEEHLRQAEGEGEGEEGEGEEGEGDERLGEFKHSSSPSSSSFLIWCFQSLSTPPTPRVKKRSFRYERIGVWVMRPPTGPDDHPDAERRPRSNVATPSGRADGLAHNPLTVVELMVFLGLAA